MKGKPQIGIMLLMIIIFMSSMSILVSLPSVSASPDPYNTLDAVKVYNGASLVVNYSDSFQLRSINVPTNITSIRVYIHSGGYGHIYDISWAMTHVNPISDIRSDNASQVTNQWQQISSEDRNGNMYYYYCFFSNFTAPFFVNYSGVYYLTISAERADNSPILWNEYLVYLATAQPSTTAQDTYSISHNVFYIAWLFIVFLPALVLNAFLPKIGFIAGILITSVALTISQTLPIWLFLMMTIGVVVLVFRGEEP